MSLPEVIASVRCWRERVQHQARLARDVWHLRAAAQMLFDDNPDKTKAVDAVHSIAARRLAAMDDEARALFEAVPAMAGDGVARDHGERLRWLLCVNRPGRFPYTQGIAEPHGPGPGLVTRAARSRVVEAVGAAGLAAALNDGWCGLAAAPDADEPIEARALQFAIAFDEHRDAEHRALAGAARRLWAVSLREHFWVEGDGLKLVLVSAVNAYKTLAADGNMDERAIDRYEVELLAALHDAATTAPST